MARARRHGGDEEQGGYFDSYGRPVGYGQYSPFTDQPEGPSQEQQALGMALSTGERSRERQPAGDGSPAVYEGPLGAQPYQSTVPDHSRTGQLTLQQPYNPAAAQQAPSAPAPQSSQPSIEFNRERGFDLLDQYGSQYTRRNEGAGGIWQGAAKGALYGGTSTAGIGAIPAAIVGGIIGAATKNAKTAKTDFAIGDVREMLTSAHKDMFGRDLEPATLENTMRGQGWEPGDKWGGEDGLAYILDIWNQQGASERAAIAAAAGDAAPTTTPEAAATQAALTGNISGAAQGALGGYAGSLEGFNMNRFADPSAKGNDTWKYRVGSVLSNYAPDAEGLAAAVADMKGRGWDVSQEGSKGDLLRFGALSPDAEGYDISGDLVDVGRGFGAAGSGWAWQGTGPAVAEAGGEGPGDLQAAYQYLQSIISPNASRAEMEAAISRAFANVPGFERGYAGDAVFNDGKLDLITDFEGANPQWSNNLGLIPLHGGGGSAGIGAGNVALQQALGSAGLSGGDTSAYSRKLLEEIMRSLAVSQALGAA